MPISLKPAPTFRAKVEIPTTDGPLVFEWEFKHKTSTDIQAWAYPEDGTRSDVDAVAEIALGWFDVDEPFSRESLEELFRNHQAAPAAICEAYVRQLTFGAPKQ